LALRRNIGIEEKYWLCGEVLTNLVPSPVLDTTGKKR